MSGCPHWSLPTKALLLLFHNLRLVEERPELVRIIGGKLADEVFAEISRAFAIRGGDRLIEIRVAGEEGLAFAPVGEEDGLVGTWVLAGDGE